MTRPGFQDTIAVLNRLQGAVKGPGKTPPAQPLVIVFFDEAGEVDALTARAEYDRATRYDRARAYFKAQGVTDPAAIRDLLASARRQP